jgi:hypothetical protein
MKSGHQYIEAGKGVDIEHRADEDEVDVEW